MAAGAALSIAAPGVRKDNSDFGAPNLRIHSNQLARSGTPITFRSSAFWEVLNLQLTFASSTGRIILAS